MAVTVKDKMVKKTTVVMVFLILVPASIYSQTVLTFDFSLMGNASREELVKVGSTVSPEGFTRVERLPNSVESEINRQLSDYRPLTNGQNFLWQGGVVMSLVSGSSFLVLLRITDARNFQWEFFAFRSSVYIRNQ
jgi:hypothetical protein